MKGVELYRRFKALALLVKPRDEVSDEEAIALASLAIGAAVGVPTASSELSQKRAEAGRRGGQRSAETRREANGTAKPKQPPKPPPKQREATHEANAEAKPEANRSKTPPVSSLPQSPSLTLPPETPKDSAVVAQGPVTSMPSDARSKTAAAAALQNHEQALEAIRENGASWAAVLCGDAVLADKLEAHRFPFVVKVLTTWHEAKGRSGAPRIGKPSSSADVRAVLLVTGMGYLPSDLCRVAKYLPTQEKFKDKASAAIMTPDVVAIALAELNDGDSRASELVRRARGGPPMPAAVDIARLAGGGRAS